MRIAIISAAAVAVTVLYIGIDHGKSVLGSIMLAAFLALLVGQTLIFLR